MLWHQPWLRYCGAVPYTSHSVVDLLILNYLQFFDMGKYLACNEGYFGIFKEGLYFYWSPLMTKNLVSSCHYGNELCAIDLCHLANDSGTLLNAFCFSRTNLCTPHMSQCSLLSTNILVVDHPTSCPFSRIKHVNHSSPPDKEAFHLKVAHAKIKAAASFRLVLTALIPNAPAIVNKPAPPKHLTVMPVITLVL